MLLPFDGILSTIALYPILLFTLLSLTKERIKNIPKSVWIFQAVFLINLVSMSYTTDVGRAGFLLERQLTILLFPLLIPIAIEVNKQNLNIIMNSFIIGNVSATIFLLLKLFEKLGDKLFSFEYFTNDQYFNHAFSNPIGIHAGYLSLYISLCIFYLISVFKKQIVFTKISTILTILIFLIGLFFLASRSVIISIGIIVLFVMPFFIIKNKIKSILISALLLLCVVLIGGQSSYIKTRFSKELIEDVQLSTSYTKDNPEPRIMRWRCAWELIQKSPLLGYGSGDEIPLLLDQYQKNNMMISFTEEFNTHNQYLAFGLRSGIIGLLIFCIALGYYFKLAFQAKHFLYIAFLIVLGINFFTENVIDSNKGIFYFAFFNTLLGYYSLKKLNNFQQG
jgi:O-antigen ligase